MTSDKELYDFYSTRKPQPVDCPDCAYMSYIEVSELYGSGAKCLPAGFEQMCDANGCIKQCAEHQRPKWPWLADVSPERAVAWLREDWKRHEEPYAIDFDAWKKAVAP